MISLAGGNRKCFSKEKVHLQYTKWFEGGFTTTDHSTPKNTLTHVHDHTFLQLQFTQSHFSFRTTKQQQKTKETINLL